MFGLRQFVALLSSQQHVLRSTERALRASGLSRGPAGLSRATCSFRWLSLAVFVIATLAGPFGLTRHGSCCALRPGDVCRCTPASRAQGDCCCQRKSEQLVKNPPVAASRRSCCQPQSAVKTAVAAVPVKKRAACCEAAQKSVKQAKDAMRASISPCPCGGDSTTWLAAAAQPRISPPATAPLELQLLSRLSTVVDDLHFGCDRTPPVPPPRIGLS